MKIKKRIMSILLCAVMALSFVVGDVGVAFAASSKGVSKSSPLKNLENQIFKGVTSDITDNDEQGLYYDCSENTYDRSGGGYYIYKEMFENALANSQGTNRNRTNSGIDEVKLGELTAGGKKKFLTDVMRIGNNLVAYYANKERGRQDQENYISEQTMNQYVQKLQNLPNVGSTLLATLMANTRPDYVTANRIYQPFSGVVGTILGFLAVMIMALLGITMALDIAYIVIPAVQLFFDGDSDGGNGQGGGAKGVAKLISQEARSAVKAADGGGGQGGQSGSQNKLAISVYFKHRWKSLLMLGICLLYLVQGEIYSLVGTIIDLVSGFVGF